MHSSRTPLPIFKRELKSYFESPVAYVFLVVFLVLVGLPDLLGRAHFYERGEADLQPFFFWHPVGLPAAGAGRHHGAVGRGAAHAARSSCC